jgi:hypothetical protein
MEKKTQKEATVLSKRNCNPTTQQISSPGNRETARAGAELRTTKLKGMDR